MSSHNPHACIPHVWDGFGYCPFCRKEREESRPIDEQMNDFFNELSRLANES